MTESLEKISFYKLTTEFAEHLKETKEFEFDSIHVTGHSLGGGLAMITGAQAEIPSVGKQSFCRACDICQILSTASFSNICFIVY
jgi:putative lipase involved disintegration of autophagic bodies